MENEELNQVETEQAEPSLEIENFDSIWGEDEEPEVREAEAEQTEAEPEEAEKSEPKQKQEAENQRFTLKVNGEEIEVDRDEVITLAQKGKDYDRIKTERDNLKADSATMTKLKGYESFLKELAESGETPMTIEQLVENTRARMLMRRKEGTRKGGSHSRRKAAGHVCELPSGLSFAESGGDPAGSMGRRRTHVRPGWSISAASDPRAHQAERDPATKRKE